MKNKIICNCAIILSIVIAIFDCFVLFCMAEVKNACDMVFESKGVYDESYSNLIDKNSFNDLSDELIYYYHREIKKGDDFKIIKYNVKTCISPLSALEFIFDNKIYVKCDYAIKYKGKVYKNLENDVSKNVRFSFEDCHIKIRYEFSPI